MKIRESRAYLDTAARMSFGAVFILASGVSSVQAHDMWVNAAAAHDPEEQTTMVVTSMGWGHRPLPISEFISGKRLSVYGVVAPDGSLMPLPFDASANENVNAVPEGDVLPGLERMQGGDAFVRRLDFGADAAPGAWRAHAALPAGVYSTWSNADGERVSGERFADELTEDEEIVSSAVTVRSSDAYWSVGEWQVPRPADVPLQLVPQSDLSSVSVGDEVVVSVYRDGERVGADEKATFLAINEMSEVDGAVDGNGDLRITLPEAGYWILRASHREPVDEAGSEYAEFSDRIDAITFTATTLVDVRP